VEACKQAASAQLFHIRPEDIETHAECAPSSHPLSLLHALLESSSSKGMHSSVQAEDGERGGVWYHSIIQNSGLVPAAGPTFHLPVFRPQKCKELQEDLNRKRARRHTAEKSQQNYKRRQRCPVVISPWDVCRWHHRYLTLLLRKKEAIRVWRSQKEADRKARRESVTQPTPSQEELSRQYHER